MAFQEVSNLACYSKKIQDLLFQSLFQFWNLFRKEEPSILPSERETIQK